MILKSIMLLKISLTINRILRVEIKCIKLYSSIRKSWETERGMRERKVTIHTTKSFNCHQWSKLHKIALIELTAYQIMAILVECLAQEMQLLTTFLEAVTLITSTCCLSHLEALDHQLEWWEDRDITSITIRLLPRLRLMHKCSSANQSMRVWCQVRIIKELIQASMETKCLPDFQIYSCRIPLARMVRYLGKEVEHSKVWTTSSTQELQVHKSILTEKESQRTISSMEAKLAHHITIQCPLVPALEAQTTGKAAQTQGLEAPQ